MNDPVTDPARRAWTTARTAAHIAVARVATWAATRIATWITAAVEHLFHRAWGLPYTP